MFDFFKRKKSKSTKEVAATGEPPKKVDVEQTIKELKAEKKREAELKNKKRSVWQIILMVLFFPITAIVWCFKTFYRSINMPLTVKMTIIYSIMFAAVLGGFSIFFVNSIRQQLPPVEASEFYIRNLVSTTVILDVIFIVVFASLGALSSQIMLKPIRTITKQIDAITGDNLTSRIKQVDSQDELKALTNQINGMLDNLEQSFNRQQNFVADASHELKTPIAVIQGYANLLSRWGKEKPEILEEGIDAIVRESENMKRIIEQMLLLARLGNMSMVFSQIEITSAIEEVVESYNYVDKKHEIEFKCNELITLETDKNMMLESVRTLVDNAIKYTNEGGKIKVACCQVGNFAEISVTDTGMGISDEDLPHIFERFYRCDKVRGREKGSSGLGLAIAKSIVEALYGDIKVVSKIKLGSTFTIRLPL